MLLPIICFLVVTITYTLIFHQQESFFPTIWHVMWHLIAFSLKACVVTAVITYSMLFLYKFYRNIKDNYEAPEDPYADQYSHAKVIHENAQNNQESNVVLMDKYFISVTYKEKKYNIPITKQIYETHKNKSLMVKMIPLKEDASRIGEWTII